MIRVLLPQHLRTLAKVDGEVRLDVKSPVTVRCVLEALESQYPMLRGTTRDPLTMKRRPMIRFFVCEEDVSHEPEDTPLPEKITSGADAFMIVGAIAGG